MVRADVDYYSVLGVDKNADKKAIKQAYRYPFSALVLPPPLSFSLCTTSP